MASSKKKTPTISTHIVGEIVSRSVPKVKFDVQKMADTDCKTSFRFDLREITKLAKLLGILERVKTKARDSCSGETALCIVLGRMNYPKRYFDMMPTFGRSESSICRIFLHTISLIFCKFPFWIVPLEIDIENQ